MIIDMEISDIRWEGQLNRHNPEESKLTLRLPSGSYIYKKWKWKSGYLTAWSDNRYVEISWNFQLNKEEYDKVHDTLNIGSWTYGVYFQSGYSIRVTDRIWFIKIIKILGL